MKKVLDFFFIYESILRIKLYLHCLIDLENLKITAAKSNIKAESTCDSDPKVSTKNNTKKALNLSKGINMIANKVLNITVSTLSGPPNIHSSLTANNGINKKFIGSNNNMLSHYSQLILPNTTKFSKQIHKYI
jgi:hypothetical protein